MGKSASINMSKDQSASNNPPGISATASFPPKPPRPLTCYGIFSVLERNLIWQQNQKQSAIASNQVDSATDPYAATRPQQYRSLVLPPNWFMVGMNRKKRKEHVIHGKITFQEMTNVIAEKWRTVDADTRAYCEMIANEELERHNLEVAAYKERYGVEAFKAQTKSSEQSKKKRKHEMGADVNGCDIALTSAAVQTNNNFNELINNNGAAYKPADANIAPSINNFNQQTNVSMNINSCNYQFNNHIGTAYDAASPPNYASAFTTIASQANNNCHDQCNTNPVINNNNHNGAAYAALSIPNDTVEFIRNSLLQSGQTNNQYNTNADVNNVNLNGVTSDAASIPNYAAGFVNNSVLQSAAQTDNNCHNQYSNSGVAHSASSLFQNYTAYYIRRKLMELQQQGQGLSSLTGHSSQLNAAQVGSSQAVESSNQGERSSDYMSDNRSDALAFVGNNEDNTRPGDELDKTFDSDCNWFD